MGSRGSAEVRLGAPRGGQATEGDDGEMLEEGFHKSGSFALEPKAEAKAVKSSRGGKDCHRATGRARERAGQVRQPYSLAVLKPQLI